MTSMRRRPTRSARVVMTSETSVSPRSASVRSRPVCASVRPTAMQVEHEYDRQRPVREQANEACRKEQPCIARRTPHLIAGLQLPIIGRSDDSRSRGLGGDTRMGSFMKNSLRSLAVSTTALVAMALGLRAADPGQLQARRCLQGLDAHRLARRRRRRLDGVQNGELVGKAKPGTNGGWLVMDKSFQDVQLYMNYKCTGRLQVRRAPPRAEDGRRRDDRRVRVVERRRHERVLGDARRDRQGDGTRAADARRPAAAARRRRRPAARSRWRRRAGGSRSAAPAAPAPAAPRGGAARAAPPARGTQVGSAGRGRPTLKAGDWNETYITIGTEGPPAGSQTAPSKCSRPSDRRPSSRSTRRTRPATARLRSTSAARARCATRTSRGRI